MDKQALMRTVILIFIGFTLGAYLGFHTGMLFKKPAPETPPTAQTPAPIAPTQNKLFSFFDTFTADKDMGSPTIIADYPEAHLLLLQYPTSQESESYAVYNYSTDTLNKEIGFSDEGSANTPEAFVGTDALLAFTYDDSGKSTLQVIDLNGQVVKTLLSNITLQEVYPKYGSQLFIRIGKDQSATTTYVLDTATLELTLQGAPKG